MSAQSLSPVQIRRFLETGLIEPYDENNLAHQEPVFPVSSWQLDNDADGSAATAHELDMQECELDELLERIYLQKRERRRALSRLSIEDRIAIVEKLRAFAAQMIEARK